MECSGVFWVAKFCTFGSAASSKTRDFILLKLSSFIKLTILNIFRSSDVDLWLYLLLGTDIMFTGQIFCFYLNTYGVVSSTSFGPNLWPVSIFYPFHVPFFRCELAVGIYFLLVFHLMSSICFL